MNHALTRTSSWSTTPSLSSTSLLFSVSKDLLLTYQFSAVLLILLDNDKTARFSERLSALKPNSEQQTWGRKKIIPLCASRDLKEPGKFSSVWVTAHAIALYVHYQSVYLNPSWFITPIFWTSSTEGRKKNAASKLFMHFLLGLSTVPAVQIELFILILHAVIKCDCTLGLLSERM